MTALLLSVFVFGYLLITLEQPLRVNKTATALLIGALLWAILATNGFSVASLPEHLSGIAGILFFLMGAMMIVELIDAHQGFRLVTQLVRTRNKRQLLWIISFIAFFLSAALDNLTTAIVMMTLLRKLVEEKSDRMLFGAAIIVSANAGGAWSPIGDVTTTMLWIGGQISASQIILRVFFPSLLSMLIPLVWFSFLLKGKFPALNSSDLPESKPGGRLVFFLGIISLLLVPAFKNITGLPPWMGIILAVGLLWLITELMHARNEERAELRLASLLGKIDLSSILFFLGILLAVAALDSAGILSQLSLQLRASVPDQDFVIGGLGLLSAIVDNVPLVAAAMGLYPLNDFTMDHHVWEMMAYCAGTGGSILIIGSAAGVVVMGMEKIPFGWWLRKISLPVLIGYLAGWGMMVLFS